MSGLNVRPISLPSFVVSSFVVKIFLIGKTLNVFPHTDEDGNPAVAGVGVTPCNVRQIYVKSF
jgi:hypothetical protein